MIIIFDSWSVVWTRDGINGGFHHIHRFIFMWFLCFLTWICTTIAYLCDLFLLGVCARAIEILWLSTRMSSTSLNDMVSLYVHQTTQHDLAEWKCSDFVFFHIHRIHLEPILLIQFIRAAARLTYFYKHTQTHKHNWWSILLLLLCCAISTWCRYECVCSGWCFCFLYITPMFVVYISSASHIP